MELRRRSAPFKSSARKHRAGPGRAREPDLVFEIGQKVRRGKWPEMEPLLDRLPAVLEEQRSAVVALDPTVCTTAGIMKWTHRDPFDRLLAATAICHNLPIVSADPVFDGVVTRLW